MPPAILDPLPITTPGARLVSVDGRTYPLESARIAAHAHAGIAVTTLTQTYRNPYPEPLEVLYCLPLPADGAVVGYTVRFGERTIVGEIRRREEARREYEEALFEGRAAALLEQDRDDTFQQRLGSLPPGVNAEVEIRVLHPLAFLPADGDAAPRWEYRFPTVVGVRYSGAPGRVRDAGRLEADRGHAGDIPTRFDLELIVADGDPFRTACESPSHRLSLAGEGAHTAVALGEAERLDRDLVVRWAACEDAVGIRVIEGPGLPGDDGRYGLVTLTPPKTARRAFARDLTILIDASGSMSGDPIRWAREIATGVLRDLEPTDRFEVIAFASTPVRLTRGMSEATPGAVASAVGALGRLEAGGATEMLQAIVEALTPLREDGQRQVLLITDGQIGFENEVVAEILNRLPANSRVHAVGVGPAPTRALTRSVAQAGRGVEVLIGSDDDVAQASRRLLRATAQPVLVDIAITGTALAPAPPARCRDLFAGSPSIVPVELCESGGTLDVTGRIAGGGTWAQRIEIPARATPTADRPSAIPLGALYGRTRIADRELRGTVDSGDAAWVDEEVEALGLRHRIVSRRTSLVAIAEEPSVDPRTPRRRERLPVEVPRGLSAEMLGLDGAARSRVGLASCLHDGSLDGATVPEEFLRRFEVAYRRIPGFAKRLLDAIPPSAEMAPSSAGPPVELRVLMMRVVGNTLVLEFESPESGFELPERVGVILGDAPEMMVTVDETRSSRRGPHPAGVVLRIALAPIAGLGDADLRSLRIVLSERWVLVAPLEGADGDR